MADLMTNIVGYAATVVGVSLMLPQVVKSWRTKKVEDLSYGMTVLYFFNCLLWLIYGLLISAMPLIAVNGIALVISVVQLGLKVKYSEKKIVA